MIKKEYKMILHEGWCKGCGICMDLCPTQTLGAKADGTVQVVSPETCIGCQSCVLHCPDFCIEVREK